MFHHGAADKSRIAFHDWARYCSWKRYSNMSREERRKHLRIDALNLLSYLVIDRKGQVVTQGVGRTLNISNGGVLLETHVPLNPDHAVSLFLALENDLVDVTGRVIHSDIGKGGKYHTGIAFEGLKDAAQEILARYVDMFQKENPD